MLKEDKRRLGACFEETYVLVVEELFAFGIDTRYWLLGIHPWRFYGYDVGSCG